MGRNSNNSQVTEFNRIVAGTSIHGEVETKGDIRIDGTVVGILKINGKLVLGATGKIEGEINCKNAEVMGSIDGKIVVSELLSLKESSQMKGDIITTKISIEPGAKISGTINMEKEQNSTITVGKNHVTEKQNNK